MRVALIRNPASHRNRAGGIQPTPFPTAEPPDRPSLRDCLNRFRADRVGLLGIDGGDGTVREVVTALAELDWFPRLAVLPRGKINLIAADVGVGRHGPAFLNRLAGGGGRLSRRRPLRLDHEGGTAYGLFLGGGGAFRHGWDLANGSLHPRGVTSRPAIAAALALTLTRSAKLSVPLALEKGDEACFLFLATSLDRLVLGLWPFWGDGAGAFRFLHVAAPPPRLALALPSLARGRPRPWMEQAYRSGRADRLEVFSPAPLILDGEEFAPADGRFTLSAGPVMEFAHP